MEASQIVIQTLNGLSYGLLLFLVAAGLSLIFGLMGIVNLAHGSYFMLGTYLGLTVALYTGSFLLALTGSILAVAAAGVVMERFFFSRLYKQELAQVLMTFGFAYIFMDITKWLWGGTPWSFPKPALFDGSVSVLGEAFPLYRLAVIVIGLLAALVLYLFLEKTRAGMIIRAGVDDKEMAAGMGVNIKRYFAAVFALGAGMSAFGGVIGGPIIGAYLGLDFEILVLALAVVVVGGLGTLKGAFWGSILIGFAETFGKAFFPDFAMFSIYVAMALILMVKPAGLLGRGDMS